MNARVGSCVSALGCVAVLSTGGMAQSKRDYAAQSPWKTLQKSPIGMRNASRFDDPRELEADIEKLFTDAAMRYASAAASRQQAQPRHRLNAHIVHDEPDFSGRAQDGSGRIRTGKMVVLPYGYTKLSMHTPSLSEAWTEWLSIDQDGTVYCVQKDYPGGRRERVTEPSLNQQADALEQVGKHEEAMHSYAHLYGLCKAVLGEDSIGTANCACDYYDELRKTGLADRFQVMFKEVRPYARERDAGSAMTMVFSPY